MPPLTSATPAHARMQHMTVVGHVTSEAIAAAAQLCVADELTSGPRHVDEIAKAVGADATSLYRLLRFLADVGVFEELEGRRFAANELGDVLRSDVPGSMRSWATAIAVPWHRQMWGGLVAAVQTGEPAFEQVLGAPPFEYFNRHPDAGAMFAGWMTTLSSLWVVPVAVGYDFGPLATVVDVGGGQGALLSAVLAAHPHLQGVLFDQPPVVADAGPVLAEAGVADRCTVVGGDFFAAVPPGGDAYVLSSIVHDWPDAEAVQILANCRAAMDDGGRVLLVEPVLPDTPEPSGAKLIDLEMLLVLDGPGRTVGELAELLRRADLRLSDVVAGDMFSLVEAVPA